MKCSRILLLLLAFLTASASAELYTQKQVNKLMDKNWNTAVKAALKDPVRKKEVTAKRTGITYYDIWNETLASIDLDVFSITDGNYTMRYIAQTIGKPDKNGLYPLYICLHGGGSDSEGGYVNNLQWLDMVSYYRDSVKNGIYVAVRGITDNWNLHFDDASYPLYDRLIEDMMLFRHADPNRVYLLGFSAGGDGVYSVAPRMADRFAAANQSSGHPNDNTLLNAANLPICIQAGIRDTMYDPQRSVVAAGFDRQLDAYRDAFGFGYEHEVYIHVPEGHNYADNEPKEGTGQLVLADPQAFVELMTDPETNALFPQEYSYAYDDETNKAYLDLTMQLGMQTVEKDTNAVRFVDRYIRNTHPDNMIWELSARACNRETNSFYWLQADSSVNTGLIYASFDRAENRFDIRILEEPNGDFSILLHPDMVDFSRPVYVTCDDMIAEADVRIDEAELLASMFDTLDRDLAYAARIPFSSLEFGS